MLFRSKIYRDIGCECVDTVVLTREGYEAGIVMLVDDTGLINRKPINTHATALYREVCRPGNPHSVHGDVAICWDGDFA